MKSFEQVLNQEKNELTEALILFGEGKRLNKALADLEINRPEFYKFYEAGQQSKQAEVDELKREMLNKTNEAYADGQKSMRKMIKSNEDELQKRIDDALNKSEDFYDFGDGESAMAFCNEIINILKGKINDH